MEEKPNAGLAVFLIYSIWLIIFWVLFRIGDLIDPAFAEGARTCCAGIFILFCIYHFSSVLDEARTTGFEMLVPWVKMLVGVLVAWGMMEVVRVLWLRFLAWFYGLPERTHTILTWGLALTCGLPALAGVIYGIVSDIKQSRKRTDDYDDYY